MLLGDLDDDARATTDVRNRLRQDPIIINMIARNNGVTSQIVKLGDDLKAVRKREIKGESRFFEDPAFQVNSTVDIVILRVQEAFLKIFNSPDTQAKLRQIGHDVGLGATGNH
jgi:hypothetical protein